MKKAILLFLCMVTMFCSFAQETPSEVPKPVLTKEEYLKKWKVQKTTAIVLISVGGAMLFAGSVIVVSSTDFGYEDSDNSKETLGAVLGIAGAVTILTSIGFFVSSHTNKEKALSISFKNESAPQLQGSMVFYRSVPSLTLKIRL